MDLLSAFKSEVLRPLVTLVVPGAITTAPYLIVLSYYFPAVTGFADTHPTAFATAVSIAVLAAGLIVEDLGSLIESKIWDKREDRKSHARKENWDKYLKLQLKDEIVGQRYLRGILVRMKFELSMVPALLAFWFGLLWIERLHVVWAWPGFLLLTLVIAALTVYLLWESSQSARVLRNSQKLMVEALTKKGGDSEGPLCVNVGETSASREFSVEGGEALGDEQE